MLSENRAEVQKIEDSYMGLSDSVGGLADDMYNSGKAAGKGFVNGISYYENDARKAARAIARAAQSELNKELKISSPSKVFKEMGAFVSEGFAIGISSGIKDTARSAYDMAKSVTGVFSRSPMPATAGAAASAGKSVAQGISNSYTIEIPVMLDGREISRVTAPYMDKDLQTLSTNRLRGAGK